MADLLTRLRADVADRYAIERELGRGGMATVYLAQDLKHHRQVAIKVLKPEIAAALGPERFLREIETTARLSHPHILPLHDSGEANGVLYYVMPFVEGESLRCRLDREKQLPLEDALGIAREVADALSYAHSRDVVHRDIKPENILLEAGHAVVSDFGIARAVSVASGDRLTETGLVAGTPAYMSPEQAMGEPTLGPRTDIYSLACVLYELLAGEPPYTGPTAQAIVAKRLGDPVPRVRRVRDTVPVAVEEALVKALARVPADRFPSALAFLEALTTPDAARASRRSIAVLPFANLSSDPENEYFADGITEDVIAQLSKIGALKVISRTSVIQFKKREQSLREIGERLGVGALLEGSVRRAGNRVRVVAQLIDAETDRHVWAETYDRQLTDIFAIQSDVALQIATALEAELTPDERARIGKHSAGDLEAYHLYLRGRHCLYRFSDEGIERSLELFRKAIEKDPQYAPPFVGMALFYVIAGMGYGAGTIGAAEAYRRAKDAVAMAVTLDGELSEARAMLGLLKFTVDFDWGGAERELEGAIALNPNSADAYDIYGLLLSSLERYDEAVAAQRRAQELDPLAPVVTSDLASTLLRAGRYDEALRESKRLIEFQPGFPMAHSTRAWALVMKGERADGVAALEQAVSLSPTNTVFLGQLGQAYALAGRVSDARGTLEKLEALSKRRYVSPYHLAYVYTGLGDQETALDWLERAYEERAGGIYGVKGSFLFTSLRSHPRFKALLKKMNLG